MDNKMTALEALERFRQDLLPDPHDERDIDASWIRRRWEKYEPIIRQALSVPRAPDVSTACEEDPVVVLGMFAAYARDELKQKGVDEDQIDAWFLWLKSLLTATPEPVASDPGGDHEEETHS